MLVLAEPLAGLPAHLLEQPEADVGGGELRVDGGLLEPLRVEVLGRPVAHRQPELLEVVLVIQIHLPGAAALPLLGGLPALLVALLHAAASKREGGVAVREIERVGVAVLY